MEKTCKTCMLLKSLDNFRKHSNQCKSCRKLYMKDYGKQHYIKNRDKILEASKRIYRSSPEAKSIYDRKRLRELRKKDPDRVRKKALKSRYNITFEEYKDMELSQNFKCAICSIDKKDFKKDLAVDHCHVTSKIRGLLCNNCNLALGYLKDDINLFLKAIEYIKKTKD